MSLQFGQPLGGGVPSGGGFPWDAVIGGVVDIIGDVVGGNGGSVPVPPNITPPPGGFAPPPAGGTFGTDTINLFGMELPTALVVAVAIMLIMKKR